MADVYASGWQVESSSNISTDITGADTFATLSGWLATQTAGVGTLTDRLPVDQNPVTGLTGYYGQAESGNDTFYNRIIVSTPAIAAGNVISQQIYTISVWNGYFVNRTLSSISASGGEGLTLTPSEAVPSTFSALEEQLWTLVIGTNGPATINAVYTLTFDTVTLTIGTTGQRIFTFNFAPDWSRALIERLEFMTDVLEAYDGTEQRIALRELPRRSFEYQFVIDNNDDRRKFEALLSNWQSRAWLVPIWTEGQALSSQLASGSISVTLPRVTSDYMDGGNLIIRTGPFTYEVVEISTVAGNVINFARPLPSSWPVGSRIYPAIPAYMETTQKVDRFTGAVLTAVVRFNFIEDTAAPAAPSETLYRGYPVLTTAPVWKRDLSTEYQRKVAVLDFGIGPTAYDDQAKTPFIVLDHHWILDTKAAIDAMRAFAYARAGKQKIMWVPTFQEDVIPVAQISSSSTSVDVAFGYITQHLVGMAGREDVRIELTSGAVYYRRITGASELSNLVERLTLDSALPVTVQPSEVSRISWLIPARQTSDATEFAWSYDDVVDTSTNWRSVVDGV